VSLLGRGRFFPWENAGFSQWKMVVSLDLPMKNGGFTGFSHGKNGG